MTCATKHWGPCINSQGCAWGVGEAVLSAQQGNPRPGSTRDEAGAHHIVHIGGSTEGFLFAAGNALSWGHDVMMWVLRETEYVSTFYVVGRSTVNLGVYDRVYEYEPSWFATQCFALCCMETLPAKVVQHSAHFNVSLVRRRCHDGPVGHDIHV